MLTKAEAKMLGLQSYSTGSPCKYGHWSARSVSGGACLKCRIVYLKDWRKKNPEKCAEYSKKQDAAGYSSEYYKKNKEKICASASNWKKSNPEKARAQAAKWRDENRAHFRKRARDYRLKNLAHWREKMSLWRDANREKCALWTKEWRAKYPDRSRVSLANKRAKRRGAEGRHTKEDIANLLLAQKKKCAWCRSDISKKYHTDHIQPLCLGGRNDKSNLQLLCPPCNLRKHASDPIDFAQREGRLL